MVDMGILIGSVRRFGLVGPPYEVLGPGNASANGETQMRILLIESGEEVEYPLSEVVNDPVDA